MTLSARQIAVASIGWLLGTCAVAAVTGTVFSHSGQASVPPGPQVAQPPTETNPSILSDEQRIAREGLVKALVRLEQQLHQERISANQKIAELQQEIAQLCERVNQLNKGAVKSVGWGKAREAKNVETPDKDGLVIAYSCNMGRVQTLWIHTAGWYSRTYPAGYSFVVAPAVKGVRWEVCAPIKKDPKGQTEFYEGFTVGDAHVLFIPLEVEYGPIKE